MVGVWPALEDPVLHEAGQPFGEHRLGYVEVGMEVAEAADAVERVTDDQQRPALADHLQRTSDRSSPGVRSPCRACSEMIADDGSMIEPYVLGCAEFSH